MDHAGPNVVFGKHRFGGGRDGMPKPETDLMFELVRRPARVSDDQAGPGGLVVGQLLEARFVRRNIEILLPVNLAVIQ